MPKLFERLLLALLMFGATASFADGVGVDSARTYVIKAGMINGFTAYTNWPEQKQSGPFVIGVLGNNPSFIKVLERFYQKKPVDGRQVIIKSVTLEQLLDCHVVIILGEANSQNPAVLERVRGHPVLTISDEVDFAQSGGHVGFYSQNNKLRFEINWPSTNESQLKVSSRLLRLARVIGK